MSYSFTCIVETLLIQNCPNQNKDAPVKKIASILSAGLGGCDDDPAVKLIKGQGIDTISDAPTLAVAFANLALTDLSEDDKIELKMLKDTVARRGGLGDNA
jgi:hypothetical protein